jgi:hypothetical protein
MLFNVDVWIIIVYKPMLLYTNLIVSNIRAKSECYPRVENGVVLVL